MMDTTSALEIREDWYAPTARKNVARSLSGKGFAGGD
jgi:hypothetical protein